MPVGSLAYETPVVAASTAELVAARASPSADSLATDTLVYGQVEADQTLVYRPEQVGEGEEGKAAAAAASAQCEEDEMGLVEDIL